MTRTVYVNGDYLPEDQAMVSVFDRGFLMADGVYEVVSVLGGKLIDFEGHMVRLKRRCRNWPSPIRCRTTRIWPRIATWWRGTTSPTGWSICR